MLIITCKVEQYVVNLLKYYKPCRQNSLIAFNCLQESDVCRSLLMSAYVRTGVCVGLHILTMLNFNKNDFAVLVYEKPSTGLYSVFTEASVMYFPNVCCL